MIVIVVAVAMLGYLAALPVLTWHRRDLLSFRRPLWAGYGSRSARVKGAFVCYAALGWPELFMALGWRRSRTRGALVLEREQMREARRDRTPAPE
ncbi:MAG: hypothetical protein ACXVJ7_13120 [Acidimicrobiia bacterium]